MPIISRSLLNILGKRGGHSFSIKVALPRRLLLSVLVPIYIVIISDKNVNTVTEI